MALRTGSQGGMQMMFGLALLSTSSSQSYPPYTSDNAQLHEMSADGEWSTTDTRGTYAQFSLNHSTITAEVAIALDANGTVANACDENTITPNPGKIVVIRRGQCRFLLKAWNVHLSGAIAMIVVDHDGRQRPPIMASGSEYIPVRMLDMISIAVRHSLGEHLIQRVAAGEQVLLQIVHSENGSSDDDDAGDDHAGRVISYTCGVAISAIVLVMSTRVCGRGPNPLGNALAALAEAENRELEQCDELLKALEGYNFDTAQYLENKGSPASPRPGRTPGDKQTDDDGWPFPSLANSRFDGPVLVISSESDGAGPAPDGDIEVPTCCVCLDNFEDDERVLRLPCRHEFHDVCIAEWLRKHRECPLCKDNVYERHFGGAGAGAEMTESVPLLTGIPEDARVQASPSPNGSDATDAHARPESAPTAAVPPTAASGSDSSHAMISPVKRPLRDLGDQPSTSSMDGLLANRSPSLGGPSPERNLECLSPPERNLSYTDVVQMGAVQDVTAVDHLGEGDADQVIELSGPLSRDADNDVFVATDVVISDISPPNSGAFFAIAGTVHSVSTL